MHSWLRATFTVADVAGSLRRIATTAAGALIVATVGCRAPPPITPRAELEGFVLYVKTAYPHFDDASCNARAANGASWARDQVMRFASLSGMSVTTNPSEPHDAVANVSINFFCAAIASDRISRLTVAVEGGAVATESADSIDENDVQRVVHQIVNAPQTLALARRKKPDFAAARSAPTQQATSEAPQPNPPASQPTQPIAPSAAPAVSTSPALRAASPQPASWALVIGVEKYRDVNAPAGARADAEAFRELLRTTLGVPEDHVVTALDDRATRGDIEKHLDWLKGNVPAGGRIYFFFSGHGSPDASGGTPYLLPYDGDPKFLERTAVPLASIMKSLGETKAREVLAVVDTCFSGAGGRSVLPPGARPLVRVKETEPGPRVALFSASSGAEISGPSSTGRGGLFTSYVLEGLGTGAADANGDGQISLKELADWVRPRVVRDAKRDNRDQTPQVVVGSGIADADQFIVGYGFAK